jgi:putative methyltransferase (TIGR04325 family)
MLNRLLNLLPAETIDGYQHPELIDVVVRKTAAYQPSERLDVAGARTVLDFGGGAGRHFKEAVNGADGLRWAVVETPAMVDRAKELATDRLRFFASVDQAAAWLGAVDLMHSNGALQYVPEPMTTLRELCGLRAAAMIWRRVFLADRAETSTQVSRLSDNGPGRLSGIGNKRIAYAFTTIAEPAFIDSHAGYSLAERGADWFRFVR